MNLKFSSKTDCGNLYRLKQVDCKKQMTSILDLTEEHLGIRFPEFYIEAGTLLALFEKDDSIVGSAFITNRSPFRSLEAIPNSYTGKIYQDLIGNLSHTVEVNGLWLDPNNKTPFVTLAFWSQLLTKLVEMNVEKVLFTFDQKNSRMAKLANLFLMPVVFSGETLKLKGMKEASTETIVLGYRDQIAGFLSLLDRRDGSKRDDFEVGLSNRLASTGNRKSA